MNTLLDANEALEIVKNHYTISKNSDCNIIRRGFNDHYLIVTDQARYIFRIYLNHKYYIDSHDAYRFELDLLKYLHQHGVAVSNAIPMSGGELLGMVSTEMGERAFALFPLAEGVDHHSDAPTVDQCFHLGSTLADIHLVSNEFSSEYERYHLNFKYLVDEPLRLIAEKIAAGVESEQEERRFARLKEKAKSLPSSEPLMEAVNKIVIDENTYEIIHSDLHGGNIHFLGDKLTVFDFDHCAFGWRAYDLAVAVYLPDPCRDSMLAGYESRRGLTKEERDCLPAFAKLRQIWDLGDILATETMRSTS